MARGRKTFEEIAEEKIRARELADRLATVVRVDCEIGRHSATLLATADPKRARQVVRAWGERLFRGATFRVTCKDGSSGALTWLEVAHLFGVDVFEAKRERLEAAERRARRPPPKATTVAVPAAKPVQAPVATPSPTAPATITSIARAGKVPVKKNIICRGIPMTVTYWVNATMEAA